MPERAHGSEPRGLTNIHAPRTKSYDGRFGRMFGHLQPAFDPEDAADDEALRAIAGVMRETADTPSSDNPVLPSGYTYLGQFIDHDITFDPASQLQRRNDPEGLLNFRTPRFDLDSVYGSGPEDEPFQYDQTVHGGYALLIERPDGRTPDVPRVRGRAAIGDPRNDENSMISQLHLAFLSFHNAVVNRLATEGGLTGRDLFEAAQREVQWHYQWIVVHDYLRRVIGHDMLDRLLVTVTDPEGSQRESVRLRHYRHKKNPYLPIEFSVAAYRFGHTQARDRYNINASFQRPLFSPNGDDFRGFQPIRPGWHASWPFFFDFADGRPPQASRAIDTLMSASLHTLPGASNPDDGNLALRNLRRGAALGLPSGQAVAQAVGEDPLSDAQLTPCPPGRAPLWFYILREAELSGGAHLGPVGGRIVGETLLGLLRADPQSYLQLQPTWTPTLPTRTGDPRAFDMVDMLTLAVPDQAQRF
jgi:hypothetical protein